MSAIIVDDEHIQFLVHAGLQLPPHGGKMRWLVRELTTEERNDAHRRGEAWGPGAIETYGSLMRELTEKNAGWVGAMLLAENAKSVNHRYDEDEWENPYVFKELVGHPNPVAVLKAIDGYTYQSCEHPEWESSEAKRFCDSLAGQASRRLPGYEDAPWHITAGNLRKAMR